MIIRWKTVEQYFTVFLFVFPFSPVFNLGRFITLGLIPEKPSISVCFCGSLILSCLRSCTGNRYGTTRNIHGKDRVKHSSVGMDGNC